MSALLAQAATGDADLRAFTDTTDQERVNGSVSTARFVAERLGLRPGLDVEAAADVLWALTSWDLSDALVDRRAWGWDRYQVWLATTMADALVGPELAEMWTKWNNECPQSDGLCDVARGWLPWVVTMRAQI